MFTIVESVASQRLQSLDYYLLGSDIRCKMMMMTTIRLFFQKINSAKWKVTAESEKFYAKCSASEQEIRKHKELKSLIPVAELSKARVYGRSLAGIAGSNPAGGMDGCLL